MAGHRASREQILQAIRDQAAADGGAAPGFIRFSAATGIGESEWRGRYWARWGDALEEAGLTRNEKTAAYPPDFLAGQLALLARELGKFPTTAEIRMKSHQDADFPSITTIQRLGTKASQIEQVADYCTRVGGYDDVVAICTPLLADRPEPDDDDVSPSAPVAFVYLVKSGKHHKIGYTTDMGRRTYEIRLQLPDKATLVHHFATDDPVGIERYWHDRFADRRANGEWFALTKADIAAFKSRRRFM